MKLPSLRRPEPPAPPPSRPKVCLLITTRNRGDLLLESMCAMATRTRPDEVLVVDDGGEDRTQAVCDLFGGITRYIYTNNPGDTLCSHARNVGIKHTDADIIITSEPEMRFESDVVAQLLGYHLEHPNEVVSVGTIHHQWVDREGFETIQGWVAPFVALYRREWLLEVGGWDESFPSPWGWEDTDLLTRLRVNGHGQHIMLAAEATHLYHPSRACDQGPNEEHFLSKTWPDDIVANRGIEWGVPR